MTKVKVKPTNHARTFGEDEIIVSKTDLKGHITYANDVFLRIAGYSEQEVLGLQYKFVIPEAAPVAQARGSPFRPP